MPKTLSGRAALPEARVDEAGRERAVVGALDEAEGDVAERRRDLDGAVAAAALVLVLRSGRRGTCRRACRGTPSRVEIGDAEREAHHAGRVALHVARGLRRAGERRRHADAHVARAEDDRLLAAPLRELVARARDLLEVEALARRTRATVRGSRRRNGTSRTRRARGSPCRSWVCCVAHPNALARDSRNGRSYATRPRACGASNLRLTQPPTQPRHARFRFKPLTQAREGRPAAPASRSRAPADPLRECATPSPRSTSNQ